MEAYWAHDPQEEVRIFLSPSLKKLGSYVEVSLPPYAINGVHAEKCQPLRRASVLSVIRLL